MTVTRLKEYIPKNNIKINPTKMIEIMYNIFIDFMKNQIDEKSNIIINLLYKEFKEKVKNNFFWYSICSDDICCYEYTDKNEDNLGIICGKKINIKYDKNDPNRYLCAEHNRSHRKTNSKTIQIKENEVYCKYIKSNGIHCKYSSKIEGYCSEHYRSKYSLTIKEVHDIINRKKYKTYIEDYIENTIIEIDKEFNKEIKLFSNIDIDSNNIVLEIENSSTMKLLEIVGGNLNNFNSSINPFKCGDTKTFTNNKLIEYRRNDKFLIEEENNINSNIKKNVKTLENLENFNISNSISNACDMLEELNNNINDNTKIFEKIIENYKNYINIEHRECEANGCTNSKQYNIIYNTYCIDHIHNRPKPSIINLFKSRINTSTTSTSTTK